MADTQVLEACASAWGFESPLPHQPSIAARKQRGGSSPPSRTNIEKPTGIRKI
jgi:hypothetical protein